MKIKKFNLEKDFKRLETYLRNQYLENKQKDDLNNQEQSVK